MLLLTSFDYYYCMLWKVLLCDVWSQFSSPTFLCTWLKFYFYFLIEFLNTLLCNISSKIISESYIVINKKISIDFYVNCMQFLTLILNFVYIYIVRSQVKTLLTCGNLPIWTSPYDPLIFKFSSEISMTFICSCNDICLLLF